MATWKSKLAPYRMSTIAFAATVRLGYELQVGNHFTTRTGQLAASRFRLP